MVDIGVNLYAKGFYEKKYNMNELLNNCINKGVLGIIITGTSKKKSTEACKFVKLQRKTNKDIKLYTTIGIHPHNSKEWDKYCNKYFDNMIDINKGVIAAIGETGLNYNRMYSPKESQIKCFEEHIKLAIKYKLPLYIHERDAFKDTINILRKYKKNLDENKIKFVIHCFTGTKDEAKEYIDLGAYIGISGWLTDKRRNKDLLEAISVIPKNKVMIETYSPHLKPYVNTKLDKTSLKEYKLNVPENLIFIEEAVKKIMKISRQQLLKNTQEFFNIEFNDNYDSSSSKNMLKKNKDKKIEYNIQSMKDFPSLF